MSQSVKLVAEPRKISGRKVKQLRRQGTIPANIFGKAVKSLAIELPLKNFQATFKTSGETNIIDLQIGKETKTRPVLVQLLNELQVEALPRDLPDKFVIDASKLAVIGDGVTIKDLAVSDKVKFLAENLEELVVKIEPPTKEEVEVKPAETAVPTEEPQPETGQPVAEKGEAKPEPKKEEPKK